MSAKPSGPPTGPDDFADAALLIAAHGSPGSQGGRTATRRHAQAIADQGLFAEVGAGFLTEKPYVDTVLSGMAASVVYVVPNMAANGYITQTKLPQALNLTGRVTERIGPKGRRRVVLTEPVGTHPLVSRLMALRIKAAIDAYGLDDTETAVLVVGHGSTKSRASFSRTETVANDLGVYGVDMSVVTAYLEEEPFVKTWRTLTDAETVLVAPFLISDGFHGSQDIPMAIGFDPAARAFQDTLAKGRVNDTTIGKRRVLYMAPLGDDPGMIDIVLARVRQAREWVR